MLPLVQVYAARNEIVFNPPDVGSDAVANAMNDILITFQLQNTFRVRFKGGYLQVGRLYRQDVRAWFMLGNQKYFMISSNDIRLRGK